MVLIDRAPVLGREGCQHGSLESQPRGIGRVVTGRYFLWGPRQYTGEVLIVLGDRPERLAPKCSQVEVAAAFNHPYNPLEDDPILVCRGLKWNLQQVWPNLKRWP